LIIVPNIQSTTLQPIQTKQPVTQDPKPNIQPSQTTDNISLSIEKGIPTNVGLLGNNCKESTEGGCTPFIPLPIPPSQPTPPVPNPPSPPSGQDPDQTHPTP